MLPLSFTGAAASAPVPPPLLPVPTAVQPAEGSLTLSPEFTYALVRAGSARLPAALGRMLHQWSVRTGQNWTAKAVPAAAAKLVIDCGPGAAMPRLGEDESYTLTVTPQQAVLSAPTETGAQRGLATLTQLLAVEKDGNFLPALAVRDQPRFPWRGLMLDVSRHWQPIEVVKRTLDGMALVKLNVLHLHLSDDQGFRVECRSFPELTQKGSDGNFFTQDQLREIVAFAAARGIRVVPEFDVPGHATSWVVSHPELASAPGPYRIERAWGVFDPVLDPTNEAVYTVLEGVFSEMAAIFPDDYFHIGGDENNGVQWTANAHIQEFIRTHGLKDNAGLHAWFNGRLAVILKKHGKQVIGWDEILHPDLPAGSVIQSWRGPEGLAAAARAGHPVVLSNGYYIDLNYPVADHYAVDPLPTDSPLTPSQQALVLGGEATMWAEWVTPDIIDTRLWPRSAAIAERFWSARSVTDLPSLYGRLPVIQARLTEAGAYPSVWPRLAVPGLDPHSAEADALRTLASVVEPVKHYQRGQLQTGSNQQTPLNELADWALPESRPAREFAAALDAWLLADGPISEARARPLLVQLRAWHQAGRLAATTPADGTPRAQDRVRMARSLAALARVGDEAIATLLSGRARPAGWLAEANRTLAEAAPGAAGVEFPFLPELRRLVAATADPGARATLPRAEWRRRIEPPALASAP